MGNERKLLKKQETDCRSLIDVCQMDDNDYHNDCDQISLPMARRMSITRVLARKSFAWARYSLEKLPIRLTLGNLGFFAVILAIVMPRVFTYIIIYPIFRLVFGTLYPAYASYKAVRTKNVKEYVKWMMYWIVFALFTCAETFTDVFVSFWFPFYYEIKIILVLWLLSPATKGSSILYRRFVHPALIRREAEIDDALARATEQGYTAVLHLGTKGVNYATTVLMQTAIKGGGGLVQQLKKSYSLSDLTGEKEDEHRNMEITHDETDMIGEPRRRERPGRRGYSPRRTQSSCNRVDMYFSEVDVEVRQPRPREPIASLTNIRSSDDISSGYSSGEALQHHRMSPHTESLLRTSSVGARSRSSKPRATTKKSPEEGEEDREPTTRIDRIPLSPSKISAEQALELLLLLSKIDLPQILSEPKLTDEKLDDEPSPMQPIDSSIDPSFGGTGIPPKNNAGSEQIDISRITEEICQEKMNELRRLISSAQSAVVVSTSDSPKDSTEMCSMIDITTSPPEAQDNDSDRAGKYNKRPAPKAPVEFNQEDCTEVDSQQALRATLVIKPGIVKPIKTIDNPREHVFVNHPQRSLSINKKKKRVKEGFSKFLAIPKNIFHSTFHKEQQDDSAEDDDNKSVQSASGSEGADLLYNNLSFKTETKSSSSNQSKRAQHELPESGLFGSFPALSVQVL